jgi:DNA-binding MarR family transcriptional regulator
MAGKQIDFDRYLPFVLVAAANAVSSGASRTYLPRFGMGVTEWRVLANLKARPGMTATAICTASGLDKAAVSRAVATLVAGGFVAGQGEAGDRRRRALMLTDTGTALHDRMIAVALAREQGLLDGFSAAEAGTLHGLLTRVLDNARKLDNS